MKKCPYCAEEIQDEALKCKHCGSILEKPKQKWYFERLTLIISFMAVGPLMLPLVWSNPGLSREKKIIITAIAIILTIFITVMFAYALKRISVYYSTIM